MSGKWKQGNHKPRIEKVCKCGRRFMTVKAESCEYCTRAKVNNKNYELR